MRSRRPFIAWAAMTLFLTAAGQIALAPAAAAQTANGNAVADVEKSVVQLVQKWEGYVNPGDGVGWRGPFESFSSCSGFFVTSTGHAVTAGHCVEESGGRKAVIGQYLSEQVDAGNLTQAEAEQWYSQGVQTWDVESRDTGSPPKLTVYAVQPQGVEGAVLERASIAQVLDYRGSEEGDVALLKIETNNSPALPVAAEDPANNTPVTSIGFPAAVAAVVDSTNQRADFKSGTVSSHQMSRSGVPMIGVNADLSGGMSGGPTVDELGNVLGVNSSGIAGEQQNFNFITDTSDLRDWLQGKGLQLLAPNAPVVATPTLPPPAPERTTPTWMWIALGVTAFVVVASITLALVMARRRRAGSSVPAPPPYEPAGAPWPPSPPNAWGPPQQQPGPWGGAGPEFGRGPTPQYGGQADSWEARQCRACGAALPSGSQFCSSCGRQA